MVESNRVFQRCDRKNRKSKKKNNTSSSSSQIESTQKHRRPGDSSQGREITGRALALKRVREKRRAEFRKQLVLEEQEKRVKAANEYYSKLGAQSASRRVVERVHRERQKRNKQVEEIIEQQRRSVQAVNVMRLMLPHYQPAYKFKSLVRSEGCIGFHFNKAQTQATPEMDKRIEQIFEEDLTFYR